MVNRAVTVELFRLELRVELFFEPSKASRTGSIFANVRRSGIARFYSARNARIASAVLATAIPSVRPSVRPSHTGIVSKRRHVARCSLHRLIAFKTSVIRYLGF